MVAKLSSVRIMSAASFVTSVPVIPIATPISARLSAGASLTPSPVIATTLPSAFSRSTRRTLSSGATRATTPISWSCRSSSSSDSAANSVPVSARPSIPSCAAMAAAVVAWSPVIMRTRIPASLQSAIASLASLRGGSTIPTSASSVSSCTSSRSGPSARKPAGSRSREATASTRSPSPASRSFSASTRSRTSPAGRSAPSTSRICDERASSTSGAPLTKQRTTLRPSSSISWKVAISL